MRKLLLILMPTLFLFSCDSFIKKNILIDNPSAEELKVVIDGKDYTITPYTSTKIEIAKGEYQIKATQNEEEIFNEKVNIVDNGVLNTTKSTYVIWSDLYLLDIDKYSELAATELNNVDTEVNGNHYESVTFEVYENDVFITENWDYGLEEFWPEEVDLTGIGFIKKSKIYRLEDLESEWGFYGDYDFSDLSDEDFEVFMDSLLNEIELEDSLAE